jgi:hypothetical protein
MSDAPKPPTHDLSVKLKDGTSGKIGVAWLNDGESVSIQLNPCTIIDSRDIERLSLFPRKWNSKKKASPATDNPTKY